MQPGANTNRPLEKIHSVIGWSSLRLAMDNQQVISETKKQGFSLISKRQIITALAVVPLVILSVALANYMLSGNNGTNSSTNTSIANTSDSPVILPPTVMAKSQPTRLTIESIKVDTSLINTGQKSDGSIDMPLRYDIAAWYDHSPTPGERGPSIIVGHVDNYKGPGVFIRLKQIKYGDTISVTRADGTVAIFSVTDVKEYSKHDFPSNEVYGGINYAGIRLITCGGPFNSQTRDYPDNVVVFGKLVQ